METLWNNFCTETKHKFLFTLLRSNFPSGAKAYFHGLCPEITFFLNISNLSKNYLIDRYRMATLKKVLPFKQWDFGLLFK